MCRDGFRGGLAYRLHGDDGCFLPCEVRHGPRGPDRHSAPGTPWAFPDSLPVFSEEPSEGFRHSGEPVPGKRGAGRDRSPQAPER